MHASSEEQAFLHKVTLGTIRVVLLGAGIAWCLQIVLPFVVPVVWGAIIATATFPLARRVFPRRRAPGAVLVGVLGVSLILVPAWLVLGSVSEVVVTVSKQLAQGQLELPAPRAEVAAWPLVGKRIYALWTELHDAPTAAIEAHLPQLRQVGRWLLGSLSSLTLGVLQSLFAVVVAALFVARAEATHRVLVPIAERFAPERGVQLMELATLTVRSVAKGVLGVAMLQAGLAWLGMVVAGVPAAGAWSLLVLIAAVAQLPTLLVFLPIVLYASTVVSTGTLVVFALWSVLVSLSDNVLKPLLLGRGVDVPMLVIVIGAIGGMLSAGIVGLFVGAVILAVAHTLFVAWVHDEEADAVLAAPQSGESVGRVATRLAPVDEAVPLSK